MIDPHGERVREFYRKQGEVRERERIIADVEKLRPQIDANGVQWFAQFNVIIATIKGETK